jgi:DedD protein
MAINKPNKRGGGDWVLGGRQLFGVFALMVVLFGMVFTLGYLLGRNQYETLKADASSIPVKPEAASKSGKPGRDLAEKQPETTPASPLPSWDFFRSEPPAKPAESQPEPAKSIVPNRTATPAAVKSARVDSTRSDLKSVSPPALPEGATVLQIAAMTRQADAVALAQALQQKRFPAFVLPPGSGRYYRVQVGPYTDAKSAKLARQKLESQGFKAITRR